MRKVLLNYSLSMKPVFKLTALSYTSLIMFCYGALLVGNALGAYNIGFIPIQWLVQLGLISIIIHIGFTRKLYTVEGTNALLWLFFWTIFVTTVNVIFGDYPSLMSPNSTIPYTFFIYLRILVLLSFISAIYIIYWLLVRGYQDSVIIWTVRIGTFVSIVAIYIYIAQIYGLPEPPRNRLGTGGGEQSVIFSYAFHRAMGTFREPSHLAEWLVVPFFLSLRKGLLNLHTVLIGLALFLTGSLTGIIGSALGFAGAIIISNPFKRSSLKILLRLTIAILIALVFFNAIAVSYGAGQTNLFQVISERMAPILFGGGMKVSDRDYIYQYLATTSLPLLGSGIGNANLLLSQYLESGLVTSFLSLYFNFMYSAGILGTILLTYFLLRPIVKILIIKKIRRNKQILFILAAYLSYLVMFAVNSEEFSMMFAVAFALLAYEIHSHESVGEARRK
ncbi:MAG: hypothetical protein A4E53_03691 [Pelotomaculum sp. PtaB.Bin104]|nr:MAG: hypothetical protein A4E53_03691 [Pelotomaculum sp. PtaB.Bin104]